MNKKGEGQMVLSPVKKNKSGQVRRDKGGSALLVLSGQGMFEDKMPFEQRPERGSPCRRLRKEKLRLREQQVLGCCSRPRAPGHECPNCVRNSSTRTSADD